jgi:hypothetical protein
MTGDVSSQSWVPAFEGQRPPFVPGNELAEVRHGAYSPRRVDPLARELVDLVLEDPNTGHAKAPHHRLALWSWARAQAQVQLLTEYLADRAEEAGNGVGDLADERIRAAYLLLHRAEARAATWSARLGLDPLSQARMKRDTAAAGADMARIMAELHRQDRERQAAVDGGDDNSEDVDDEQA